MIPLFLTPLTRVSTVKRSIVKSTAVIRQQKKARHRLRLLMLLSIVVVILPVSLLNPLTTAHAQSKTTLRVLWTTPTDASVIELLNGFIADFEAQHSDLHIELIVRKTPEVRDMLEKAIGSNTGPDIALSPARWIPEFVSLGMIHPLEAHLTDEFKARFIPQIINQGAQYQGKIFGLPVGTSTRALYYNKALFTAAGISAAPQTWDDLLQTGKAITALGTGAYGFGLQGGGGPETNTYFYYFVWGNGGDLYAENSTQSALNKPESVEALQFLQKMIQEKATQPDPTSKAYETRLNLEDLFQAGKLGMIISGPWLAARLHKQAPTLDFGIAPIPYHTTPATYGVMDALVILDSSHHKDEAWQFLEFLYDDKRRLAYDLKNGVLPELISVAKAPELTQDKDFSLFLSLLPDARFEPLHIKSEDIAQITISALQTVYKGNAEPQDALDKATLSIDKLLATNASGW